MRPLAALADEEHVRKTVGIVNAGRDYLERELRARKLEYLPSSANFILVNVGDGRKVFQQLMRRGVIVRPMDGYKLPAWIRVTIGTEPQNKTFFEKLDIARC